MDIFLTCFLLQIEGNGRNPYAKALPSCQRYSRHWTRGLFNNERTKSLQEEGEAISVSCVLSFSLKLTDDGGH